jgi:hypothetical protein
MGIGNAESPISPEAYMENFSESGNSYAPETKDVRASPLFSAAIGMAWGMQ